MNENEKQRKRIESYARKNWKLTLKRMNESFKGSIRIREFLIVDDPRGGVMLYHGPSGRFRVWPSEVKQKMVSDMKKTDIFDKELVQLIWEV